MASTRKSDTGPRRGHERDEISKGILDSYHTTEGCPPLTSHWGGYDLAKTDWLKMFAEEIAGNHYKSLNAWRTLEKKCDTSWIIELLYLLTLRGKCLADQNQDVYHALIAEVEKIIAKYEKLRDDIVALVQNSRLSFPMTYIGCDLLKEIRTLEESKKRLETLRDANEKWGSYKRNSRDWYLFLLAAQVINATGRSHVKELASLIESARAAHKERTGVGDEDALKKRIQRWAEFLNAKVVGGKMLFPFGKTEIASPPEGPADSADAQVPF